MTPTAVLAQINDLISRLIKASLSVDQEWATQQISSDGDILIGSLKGGSVALRNLPYESIYSELESNRVYHAKLVDGGLIQLQYTFTQASVLRKQRLAYFPNPKLPTIEDAPELYEEDELYGDIIAQQLVRFPVRIDFAPDDKIDIVHPATHLTLGQYESCRIPVVGPVGPVSFGIFIVRNFYHRAYRRHQNNFDRKPLFLGQSTRTISKSEQLLSHFVPGR